MWKNIFGDTDKAKERIASALEKTSDILNEKANEHAAWLKKENEKESEGETKSKNSTAKTSETIVIEEEEPIGPTLKSKKANDVINSNNMSLHSFVQQKDEMLGKMQLGWGNMVKATQKHMTEAQQQIKKSTLFQPKSDHRDLSLPFDVDALRDAEVVYVTNRLITMGHPSMQSSTDGDITARRKLLAVGHLLKKRHEGRFMVWDLSEVPYDYSVLDDEVLPFHFPGSPSPPLGMLLKLLLSIESWLKADSRNVAVFHCLTGKGRTSTVLACFLCWTGEAGFNDPIKALEYIAACKRCSPSSLTIPSQRRYASYFSNMLDGVRPHQPPLVLKRIIMSEAPKYGRQPTKQPGNAEDADESKNSQLGCSPYLQLFKAGHLIFTTTANVPNRLKDKDELPFCGSNDGSISFPIEVVIQGDVLIRCRHISRKGQRVSMFRAAFHTGYVATKKVMRLTKSQLDGACTDKRFVDDFFLDLIFEACDSNMASKHLTSDTSDDVNKIESTEATKNSSDASSSKTQKEKKASSSSITSNEAHERRMQGTLQSNSKMIASTYDSMLHRDSRFWDVIGKRRNEHFSNVHADSKQFEDGSSVLSGPTIGKRRDFSKNANSANSNSGRINNKNNAGGEANHSLSSIDTFSIGDSFGIMADEEDKIFGNTKPETKSEKKKNVRKKDSLMEALMAIDDDIPASNKATNNSNVNKISSQEDSSTEQNKGVVKSESSTHLDDKNKGDEDVASTSNVEEKNKDDATKAENEEDDEDNDVDIGNLEKLNANAYEYDDDDEDDEELEDLENFLTKKK